MGGRSYILMPGQFLNRADVITVIEQMGIAIKLIDNCLDFLTGHDHR